MERLRLKKHELQGIEKKESTIPCLIGGDEVSLFYSSMSTETEIVAASTQYVSEYIGNYPKVLKVTGKRPRRTYSQMKLYQFVKKILKYGILGLGQECPQASHIGVTRKPKGEIF